MLHLNGILAAQQGSVTVAGLAVAKPNLREIRRRVGIVFQDPDDQLFMPTVAEDVAFGPANFGRDGRRRWTRGWTPRWPPSTWPSTGTGHR